MSKKDSHEVDFCKNIILDVLKTRLKAEQDPNSDAYRFKLFGIIDRELLVQGSIVPAIKHLQNLKEGLINIFDDVILEIKERNGSGY